jgi:hypothetical protein
MARLLDKKLAEPPVSIASKMRVFGTKPFMRFARKFNASDKELWEGTQEDPDADLGGHVFKFRLGREGEGSSGGARLIVAMKKGERIVMMFAFEKRKQANIDSKELKAFKRLAKSYLERSEQDMDKLVKLGDLEEIEKPTEPPVNKKRHAH